MLHPSSAWRWREHGPLKWSYPTTIIQSITTQKTLTWIFTVVKTSHLAEDIYFSVFETTKEHGLIWTKLKGVTTVGFQVWLERKPTWWVEWDKWKNKIPNFTRNFTTPSSTTPPSHFSEKTSSLNITKVVVLVLYFIWSHKLNHHKFQSNLFFFFLSESFQYGDILYRIEIWWLCHGNAETYFSSEARNMKCSWTRKAKLWLN